MSQWPSTKARQVLKALLANGWFETSQSGSHKKLRHHHFAYLDFVWAFHDNEEIGPRMLARIAKKTGLKPEHL